MILMKQDDDDTDREISNEEIEDPGVSTLSYDIEEDKLDIRQEVLHLDPARHDKTKQSTRVPLPKKQSHADTAIAHTPLPNLRHSVGAIALLLLKAQKSAINMSHDPDIVQALPLPETGGDHNVPQPKASGDHNVSKH